MKNASGYLKLRVLAAIDYAEGKSLREKIENTSKQTFVDEQGIPRKYTWRTITTWYYRYRLHGVTGLDTKQRSDKGMVRKITPEELLEAINTILPRFREKSFTKLDLYRECLQEGLLSKSQIAQTTFYRFVREYGLLEKEPEKQNKRRQAFSMPYANDLWQADTMFGPHILIEEKYVQAKLIAFIDDASRVICHAQFFQSETAWDLVSAFRSAIYKRGIPKKLYVDHGTCYMSLEIKNVCDRIGCSLLFTPVRDAQAKGKIERFFHTLRMQFLSRKLDLSSLKALNRQLTEYIEDDYNSRVHSAISMKPVDRFALDRTRIEFLAPSIETDELFYAEDNRCVKNDNTFSFKSKRYETPVHLTGKKIQVRYDRKKPERLIIYYKNERMGEAIPLNLVLNSNRGGKS